VAIVLFVLLAVRFWPRVSLSESFPLSTSVWSEDGQLLRVTLASDDQYRLWTPLSEISPALTEAFLLKEDRWFRWHPGVNPVALARAAVRTWRGGGRQGGSTITMQLARLMYRLNTKTPGGKLRQAAAALWLEARYAKRDILEAYLNAVPFGGNVQGVGAASRIYFSKPVSRIDLAEALTLAVIPQSPNARAGQALPQARARLGALWLRAHSAGESERRQIETPVALGSRHQAPDLAPHLVDAVLREQGRPARIDTTLNADMQRVVETQIERYLNQFGERGIRNVAALVVDSRDMEVKAWVGSADYHNEAIHGQINGVLTKRSPGSTLKPFIFGLALDQGVLHPRTILRDAPSSFGPFTPENFDGRFFGPISAQEALIRSRNVPAVWVSTQLRQPDLYQFLENAGIGGLKPEPYYGLALALGGGEVTMEELAGLYAMLANQGTMRPLRTLRAGVPREGLRLLSPEAAFITMDMLRHNPRPDDDGVPLTRGRWPIAWKTGTSWGFRDAWSAGIAGPYVLTVWIGDFEAQGNPSFVGVDAAAPLFFRIADALNLARPNEAVPPLTPPKGVSKVTVCTASGDLPNVYCPETAETWYIPGKSPIRVSQLHRAVAIDTQTGRPACPSDAVATRLEVFEFWPSDMMKLFREAGMPRRAPPKLPDCALDDSSEAPRIASPLRNVTYTLGEPTRDSIALETSVAADVRDVFWFDGGALIARTPVSHGALAWRPASAGTHLIRAIDDHGRAAERDVEVAFTRPGA
jgi:penicillin-binding protein 1C